MLFLRVSQEQRSRRASQGRLLLQGSLSLPPVQSSAPERRPNDLAPGKPFRKACFSPGFPRSNTPEGRPKAVCCSKRAFLSRFYRAALLNGVQGTLLLRNPREKACFSSRFPMSNDLLLGPPREMHAFLQGFPGATLLKGAPRLFAAPKSLSLTLLHGSAPEQRPRDFAPGKPWRKVCFS